MIEWEEKAKGNRSMPKRTTKVILSEKEYEQVKVVLRRMFNAQEILCLTYASIPFTVIPLRDFRKLN